MFEWMQNILIGAQVFCWQKFVIQLVPKTPKIYGIKALEKKAQKQPPFKGIIAIKPDWYLILTNKYMNRNKTYALSKFPK